MSEKKLVVVSIDNFYESVQNEQARSFFSDLCLLRADAYGPEYPDFYLPLDSTDYVARQYLICEQNSGRLQPIAGLRHILLEQLDFYKLPFSLLATTEKSAAPKQSEILASFIHQQREEGRELMYSSRFAIVKEKRTDRELTHQIQEIIAALMCMDTEVGCQRTLLGGAVLRFRTDTFYKKIGWTELKTPDGEPLEPYEFGDHHEPLLLIKMTCASVWARHCWQKHRSLIEEGIHIFPSVPAVEKIAA